MVRGVVDEVGVFGAYKVLELVMPMYITRSGNYRGSAMTETSYCWGILRG